MTDSPSETPSSASISKKGRIRRVTTGCLDCRRRRVKCPEGVLDVDGRKQPCGRCARADITCWYPRKGSSSGTEWVKAGEDGGEILFDGTSRTSVEKGESLDWFWKAISDLSPKSSPTLSLPPRSSSRQGQAVPVGISQEQPGESSRTTAEETNWATASGIDILSTSPLGENTSSFQPGITTETLLLGVLPSALHDTLSTSRSPSLPFNSLIPIQSSLNFPPIEVLHSWSMPSPSVGPGAQALSSLPSHPLERTTIAYFETRGCNEITSVYDQRANWIYSVLFPRLQALLVGPVDPRGPGKTIRDYVYHCILRLSFVHRGNMEVDHMRRMRLKEEARSHRDKAAFALIKAKVSYAENSWRSEEYLMGFFIGCMADLLDSQRAIIDPTTAFDVPSDQLCSDFAASLRDMIGVYSTALTVCTPHDPNFIRSLPNGLTTHFEVARSGSEWVERFFGITRHMIRLLGEVNWLVMNRVSLIRAGLDPQSGLPSLILMGQAEKLANEIGAGWLFNEGAQPSGKSERIQRGTEVFRQAILTLILCELLDTELSDYRLKQARHSALELVADTDPDETAGYSLPLTLLAVYTPDRDTQNQFRTTLRSAQDWSFGPGFQGVDELMGVCWKILVEDGKYQNGIAPWRELLSACGRSVYL